MYFFFRKLWLNGDKLSENSVSSLQMRKIRSDKTPENVLEEAYDLPEGLKLA